MKKIVLTLMLLTAFAVKGQNTDSTITVIRVSDGALKGSTKNGVSSFKGIPYAAAPVGANRWRAPQGVISWKKERDATQFAADCAQMGWPRNGTEISKSSSEDCLFLNIWKPADARPGSKLPVMVWIHGGGFVAGSGRQQEASGASFSKQGVILVSINYRLGRLGFLLFRRCLRKTRLTLKVITVIWIRSLP
jgi:para-nitrobenzyl esterase